MQYIMSTVQTALLLLSNLNMFEFRLPLLNIHVAVLLCGSFECCLSFVMSFFSMLTSFLALSLICYSICVALLNRSPLLEGIFYQQSDAITLPDLMQLFRRKYRLFKEMFAGFSVLSRVVLISQFVTNETGSP